MCQNSLFSVILRYWDYLMKLPARPKTCQISGSPCGSPSLQHSQPFCSSTVLQCSPTWFPLHQAFNGHTHCTGTLMLAHLPVFTYSVTHFQPKWEPNIILHLPVCSLHILLNITDPSPALPGSHCAGRGHGLRPRSVTLCHRETPCSAAGYGSASWVPLWHLLNHFHAAESQWAAVRHRLGEPRVIQSADVVRCKLQHAS